MLLSTKEKPMRYGKSVVLAGLLMGLASLQVDGLPAVAQTVAQTTEQRKAEAERLFEQGNQQYQVSQFAAALKSWQQALAIYRDLKNRRSEGNALGSLGLVGHLA